MPALLFTLVSTFEDFVAGGGSGVLVGFGALIFHVLFGVRCWISRYCVSWARFLLRFGALISSRAKTIEALPSNECCDDADVDRVRRFFSSQNFWLDAAVHQGAPLTA